MTSARPPLVNASVPAASLDERSTRAGGSLLEAPITAEQVRALLAGIPTAVAVNLMIAGVTAAVLWGHISLAAISIWLAAFGAAQVARLGVWVRAGRLDAPGLAGRWRALLRAGALLSGLGWGALPVFLFPLDLPHQLFQPFVAAGVTAAAVAGFAPDRVSAMLFLTSVLSPLILRLFSEGGMLPTSMGVMICLYFGYLAAVSRRSAHAFVENCLLRTRADQQHATLSYATRLGLLGSWSLDVASGALAWSQEVFMIYGRDPATFTPDLATYYREIVHPADVANVQRVEQDALREPGRRQSIDHRVLLPSGDVRWVHVEGATILRDDGQPARISGAVQDVTARKLTELQLHDREERYRALFATSRDAIVTLAPPSWRFTSGNAAAIELFGVHDEAELCSLAPSEGTGSHQPDGDASVDLPRARYETALRDGTDFFNWQFRRRDGHEPYISVRLTRVTAAGETFLQATIRDTTELVQAERALRRQGAIQRVISALAARLLSTPADAVIDTPIVEALRAAGGLLGVDRGCVAITSTDGVPSVSAWCADGVEPHSAAELDAVVRCAGQPTPARTSDPARSSLVVPIMEASRVLGEIGFDDLRRRRDWSDEDIDFVRVMGDIIASAVVRRRGEASARASEARLSFLLASSPAILYTRNASSPFAVTFVSPNIARLFGYQPEQYTGDPGFWPGRVHPDDRGDLLARLSRLFEHGEHGEHEHEYRVLMPDGAYRWVHDKLRLVRDASGEPFEIVGFWADIEQRRRAEEETKKNKERLRRGQLYANIGTWEWNIQTGALFWTERISPLFGHPEGDLVTSYDNFLASIHPEDRQQVIDAINASVDGVAPYEIEHRVVWPDGQVRWVLERGAVQRDPQGRPLQMLGVVQDIDGRKRLELALQETMRSFKEAQALARLGSWRQDLATQHIVWSDELLAMLGVDPASPPLSFDEIARCFTPASWARLSVALARARAPGTMHELELELATPEQADRWLWVRVEPERTQRGEPVGIRGVAQDITRRKQTESALIAAREAADRANQTKSEFVSNMSHELRTPMHAILGFSQLLELDDSLSSPHRDRVAEIRNAGNHLLALINAVLELSKIEAGHVELVVEAVDLGPLVAECVAFIRPLANRRSIWIEHADLGGALVRGDRIRIRQCLLNLLSNAVKYNREGGDVIVDVANAGGGRLRLSISDSGAGIPEHRRQELFRPFSRLGAEASDIEGTGIGLTITRKLVTMMGGSVGVESELGVGSVFWIELPCPAASIAIARTKTPQRLIDPASLQADEGRHVVLYVEDNTANVKLMQQICAMTKDVKLLIAHSAPVGLELARSHRPRLIILDINMPGMDGYELLLALQADPVLKDVPVFALSANAMPHDIERGLVAGFREYLTKPLDVRRFQSVLATTLRDDPRTP